MTNKVAFVSENDNDSHLDLQVKYQKKLINFQFINIGINLGDLYTVVYF